MSGRAHRWTLAAFALVPCLTGAPRKPVYVGVRVCAQCHTKDNQVSRWQASKHSGAWTVLARPEAREIAAISGLRQEPQKAAICVGCHAPAGLAEDWEKDDTFRMEDGVQCEACHGPGSEYATEEVMRDRQAAMRAGLRLPSKDDCTTCHIEKGSHTAVLKSPRLPVTARPRYKTPVNLAVRPGRKELYVVCEGSDTVIVVDLATRAKLAEIPVGGQPQDVAFSPDGRRALVSNRHDDTLSVIDTESRSVVRELVTGDEPHGVLTDRQGRLLYVLNTASEDITVFDASSLERVKTLSAGRGPWSLSLSPDGARLLVTNMLSRIPQLRAPFVSEVTVVETGRGTVEDRWLVPDANLMMGVAWHPSGRFALATLSRTKSLVPMTRLLQGWTITNGLAVLWADGRVDQVLLDEPNMGFADATDVVITPDGIYALVTSATTDRIAVVDIDRLLGLLARASQNEREHVLPNHLGKSAEFVTKYIVTAAGPRGLVIAPGGKTAFAASAFGDCLTVIDLTGLQADGRIDLGGPKATDEIRRGERLFHSASSTFHRQFSCSSCHPDGHVDGVTYDIESDGIGVSPVDNRTLRGILDTSPFKWEGTNPSLSRQCGARLSVFFTRLLPFTPEELTAVDKYVTTIVRPPNRFRPLGAPLTPAQRRGKELFERTATVDGREIPAAGRCIACHRPPYYTDRRLHDVGTRRALDRQGGFDTPHLNNIYDSAPYLHNGMAPTLEEIWTVYNPEDRHGVTNDMTKDQLNDLIEYLKTL